MENAILSPNFKPYYVLLAQNVNDPTDYFDLLYFTSEAEMQAQFEARKQAGTLEIKIKGETYRLSRSSNTPRETEFQKAYDVLGDECFLHHVQELKKQQYLPDSLQITPSGFEFDYSKSIDDFDVQKSFIKYHNIENVCDLKQALDAELLQTLKFIMSDYETGFRQDFYFIRKGDYVNCGKVKGIVEKVTPDVIELKSGKRITFEDIRDRIRDTKTKNKTYFGKKI